MNYLFTLLTTEGHLYPTVLHTVWGRITRKTRRKATAIAEEVGACNNYVGNSPDVDTIYCILFAKRDFSCRIYADF